MTKELSRFQNEQEVKGCRESSTWKESGMAMKHGVAAGGAAEQSAAKDCGGASRILAAYFRCHLVL